MSKIINIIKRSVFITVASVAFLIALYYMGAGLYFTFEDKSKLISLEEPKIEEILKKMNSTITTP